MRPVAPVTVIFMPRTRTPRTPGELDRPDGVVDMPAGSCSASRSSRRSSPPCSCGPPTASRGSLPRRRGGRLRAVLLAARADPQGPRHRLRLRRHGPGAGTALIAAIGIFAFGESATALKVALHRADHRSAWSASTRRRRPPDPAGDPRARGSTRNGCSPPPRPWSAARAPRPDAGRRRRRGRSVQGRPALPLPPPSATSSAGWWPTGWIGFEARGRAPRRCRQGAGGWTAPTLASPTDPRRAGRARRRVLAARAMLIDAPEELDSCASATGVAGAHRRRRHRPGRRHARPPRRRRPLVRRPARPGAPQGTRRQREAARAN